MRKEKLRELQLLIDELKTIEKDEITKKQNFITIKPHLCTLNNGMKIVREQILKNGLDGSAASILPVTKDNRVILTVEPRVFTKRTVGVGIPAGYIEQDENAKDGALREMLEEIGFTTDEVIDLGGFYQDMGCSAAYNRCFIALNAKKTNQPKFDESEIVKYFECYFDEALELIEMGYIGGCNSVITIMRAKEYMKGKKL